MIVMEGMLNEKEVGDKDYKVCIQLMEAEVEFQSEEHEITVADNEHKLKGTCGACGYGG